MGSPQQFVVVDADNGRTIRPEEDQGTATLLERRQQMARRRFQDPTPFREGNWWWINPWLDEFVEGRLERKRKRMKVCPAETPDREARKIAAEMLRPMNQGLQTIGSATRFAEYVEGTYRPTVLPLLATTTRASYEGTLRKYLLPTFGETPLRDMNTLTLQRHFSSLGSSKLGGDTVLKIKEVLSSVLGSAMRFDSHSESTSGGADTPVQSGEQEKTEAAHHPGRVRPAG